MFVKLTLQSNKTVYVNTSKIQSFQEGIYDGKPIAYIRYINGDFEVVKETPEEVLKLVEGQTIVWETWTEDSFWSDLVNSGAGRHESSGFSTEVQQPGTRPS